MKNIVKVMVIQVLVGSIACGNSLPPTPEYYGEIKIISSGETINNI